MYTEKASKDPAHFAQMWLVLAIAARDVAGKVKLPIFIQGSLLGI